jgi:ABC-type multidrug transport system fused ATPase/permease subunit
LEKDADFYDQNNPSEMASKISKEIGAIQRGTGEKVGSIIQAVSGFIFGFIFAFYWGWLLALILVGTLPVMLLMGVGMAMSLTTGGADLMKSYSQSAGYAEQALASIKVVHTYGQELLEERNYGKYLTRSQII